jgi:hypothetical protein
MNLFHFNKLESIQLPLLKGKLSVVFMYVQQVLVFSHLISFEMSDLSLLIYVHHIFIKIHFNPVF